MISKNNCGYLQIDFAFVVLIFFSIFYLVHDLHSSGLYVNEDLSRIVGIGADSKDLCRFLISSPGYPSNWHENLSVMNFPGLKSPDDFTLSVDSIAAFNSTNYFSIVDSLNLGDFLRVSIYGLNTSTKYLEFGVDGGDSTLSSSARCFSIHNDEIVGVEVTLWN